MSEDIFGVVIDADLVETALRNTLQTWLPTHLWNLEQQRGLTQGTLPLPKAWPVASEFDMDATDAVPAVFIASPGSVGAPQRNERGDYRKTWRFEIAAVLPGRNETEARKLASLYIAAITTALLQNRTLGGLVENTRVAGPDDQAYGTTERGAHRAVYGVPLEITVRSFVNDRLGPIEPPADPHSPTSPFPPSPLTADITVTLEENS